jgi:hypothetical protein
MGGRGRGRSVPPQAPTGIDNKTVHCGPEEGSHTPPKGVCDVTTSEAPEKDYQSRARTRPMKKAPTTIAATFIRTAIQVS